jgi:hypothetical protein
LSFPGAEGDLWDQVGRLAEKGQDLVLTQHIQQAEIQYQDAVLQAETEENELADRIRNNADEDTYEKELQTSISTMNKFMPKNPLAAKQYTAWMKRQMPEWEKAVIESKQARLNDKSIAQIELLASQGELGQLRVKLDAAIKTGVITKTNAERIWRSAVEETTEKQEEAARRAIIIGIGAEVSGIEDSTEAQKRLNALIKEYQLTYTEQSEVRARLSAEKAVQKEAKEAKDNEVTNEVVTRLQALAPDTADYINANVTDAKERDQWLERFKKASEMRLRGEDIITNEGTRGRLLDMAASIAWPERQVKIADVLRQANKARYDDEVIDDTAYNEVRDAIRRAKEDKSPFTEAYIEQAIGELMTGAPSSIMGMPLPILRTREDHVKHAVNKFGRFVNRIPGVMDAINAKFPPPAESKEVEAAPDNPAFDFDGEEIGYYNDDGSITLNREGVRRLYELAGRDALKVREMAEMHRYIIPGEGE